MSSIRKKLGLNDKKWDFITSPMLLMLTDYNIKEVDGIPDREKLEWLGDSIIELYIYQLREINAIPIGDNYKFISNVQFDKMLVDRGVKIYTSVKRNADVFEMLIGMIYWVLDRSENSEKICTYDIVSDYLDTWYTDEVISEILTSKK